MDWKLWLPIEFLEDESIHKSKFWPGQDKLEQIYKVQSWKPRSDLRDVYVPLTPVGEWA